jgi:trans-aconitate 2-methyltransferase
MFGNLAAVMLPGAQLAAQCGGAGNVSRVASALKAMGYDWTDTKNYATPAPGAPFEEYLRTIVLRDYVRRLPEEEGAAFVHEVASRVGEPELDYVRLNIDARRG